ncbi:hypothetical protein D779_0710 [Imhoffiella purpurea]|uniref:Uncharacterized protein n=1 Tax=Imhoffiella purpurea TaxID=1249627 RepID=W9VIS9_9GAMM|nr:hypothetical protein D779_0710 [Imhoffiella purpurea]
MRDSCQPPALVSKPRQNRHPRHRITPMSIHPRSTTSATWVNARTTAAGG